MLRSGCCLGSNAALNLGPKLGRKKLLLHFAFPVSHFVEPAVIAKKILVSNNSDQLVMLFGFSVEIALGGHYSFLRELEFVVGVDDLDFD